MTEGDSGYRTITFTISVFGSFDGAVSGIFRTRGEGQGTPPGGSPATATPEIDYGSEEGSFFFTSPGQSRDVRVAVYGDVIDEPDEFFYFQVRSLDVVSTEVVTKGIILDDDLSYVSNVAAGDVVVAEGDTGTRTADFVVSLSPASSDTVTVEYGTCGVGCRSSATATPNVDYVVQLGTLTFPPGVTTVGVAVTVNGDTEEEPDEIFYLELWDAVNAGIADQWGVATIVDDDTPGSGVPLVAADGPYVVERGAVLRVEAPGLLGNDVDPSGTGMWSEMVEAPTAGWVDVGSDGSFSYTHEGGPGSGDSFTYRAVNDTGASAPVTVSIGVVDGSLPPASPPPAGAWVVSPLDGHAYALTEAMSVGAAESVAVGWGGHLVSIGDAAEQDWLYRTFGWEPFWIGLNDRNEEGTFAWISGEALGYANWCTGEPNDRQGEDAVTMGGTSVRCWNDVAGTGSAPGIVERSAPPPSVSPPEPGPIGPDDGDVVGLADPSTGRWYLPDGHGDLVSFFFGNPGDVPFMGDWDCDGVDTPGLFRTSDAYVYLRNSNTQGIADVRFFFGNPSDVALAGDFDGDGCDSLSIYRPSEQRFYVMNRLGADEGGLGAAEYSFVFGNPGDKPVVGDWDGDGIDEVGLHRASSGLFYWRDSLTQGVASGEIFFGDPGDRFVAGDWGIVDGADTPAVFRPGDTTVYFRHTLTAGTADHTRAWGEASWLPVAGHVGP